MVKRQITKKELNNFIGGFLISIFGFLIILNIRETLFMGLTPFTQIIIGVLGVAGVLWWFNR